MAKLSQQQQSRGSSRGPAAGQYGTGTSAGFKRSSSKEVIEVNHRHVHRESALFQLPPPASCGGGTRPASERGRRVERLTYSRGHPSDDSLPARGIQSPLATLPARGTAAAPLGLPRRRRAGRSTRGILSPGRGGRRGWGGGPARSRGAGRGARPRQPVGAEASAGGASGPAISGPPCEGPKVPPDPPPDNSLIEEPRRRGAGGDPRGHLG